MTRKGFGCEIPICSIVKVDGGYLIQNRVGGSLICVTWEDVISNLNEIHKTKD